MEASEQVTAVMTLVTRFVDDTVAALVNSKIYWSEHPRVQSSIVKLRNYLAELAGLTGEESISIAVSKDFLIFQSRPLLGASITAPRLIKSVQGWNSGGLQVDVDASANNFSTFLEVLAQPPKQGDTHETINNLLERRRCSRIRLLAPYVASGEGGDGVGDLTALQLPVRLYQEAIEILQNTTVTVCSGGRIQFDDIHDHAEQMVQSLQRHDGPMLSLAREEQYDAFTLGHSVRVSVLAMNFGRALTSDSELLVRLGTAALLHDVGKSVIPFEILHSTAPLTEEERVEIGRHPLCGAEILLDHDDADEMSIATAFGHHQTMDCAGYPKTMHDYRQSMATRIVKICDVYEALTAARPYKRPITPTRAYRIMVGMGNHFDLRLLRKFIEVNGVFPNGQLLEMSTGELARVQQQGTKLLLPTVQVITDLESNPLEESDRRTVVLGESDTSNLFITRALDEDLFDDTLITSKKTLEKQESAHDDGAAGGIDLGRLDDPTYC